MLPRWRIALAAAILLLPAMPAAAAAEEAEASYARMARHDSWTSFFQHQDDYGTRSTTTTVTFVGRENVTIRGVTYETMRFEERAETRATQSPGSSNVMEKTFWRLPEDGALVKEQGESRVVYSGAPFQTTSYTRTFTSPCAMWRWPLVVGAEWTSSCSFVMEVAGKPEQGSLEVRHKVVGVERVDVPAGTFDAWIVEKPTSSSSVFREWYAPDACGVVRSGAYWEGEQQFPFTELQEYRCTTPPATPAPDDGEVDPGNGTETPSGNATTPPPTNGTLGNETPPEEPPVEDAPANETDGNATAPPTPTTPTPATATPVTTTPAQPTPTTATPTPPTEPAPDASPTPVSSTPTQPTVPTAAPSTTPTPVLPAETPAEPVEDAAPEGTVIAAAEHGHPEGMPGKSTPFPGAFVAAAGAALAALALARRGR